MEKENNVLQDELFWLDQQLRDIEQDLDSFKYSEIDDRKVYLETAKGSVQKVTATIEQQKEAYRKTLKDYILLLEKVKPLREEKTVKEKALYGSGDVNKQIKNLTIE